ncbi:MAG: hypothetical protein IKS77_01140, partial [Spirochaetales bacterium]|nr:hypothetical protein [Spirochaetales bacterium]
MANKLHHSLLILIVSILLLVSCSMDIFASGSSETRTSNSSTYSNAVSVDLDGDNLYPSTYDESDYTYWQTYDFGTEYVFNVQTGTWVGTSPADAGVATVTLKSKSLKITNLTDSPINITLTGTNETFKVTIEGNSQ